MATGILRQGRGSSRQKARSVLVVRNSGVLLQSFRPTRAKLFADSPARRPPPPTAPKASIDSLPTEIKTRIAALCRLQDEIFQDMFRRLDEIAREPALKGYDSSD
ncbi:hypothetical protein RHOSPDRAFT_37501 [Rhodotorula sp. JG-1b]|nr:hypothetical protein RHOSPDRAFT_37501 [Rhodotorula sp. JG-1b]